MEKTLGRVVGRVAEPSLRCRLAKVLLQAAAVLPFDFVFIGVVDLLLVLAAAFVVAIFLALAGMADTGPFRSLVA